MDRNEKLAEIERKAIEELKHHSQIWEREIMGVIAYHLSVSKLETSVLEVDTMYDNVCKALRNR